MSLGKVCLVSNFPSNLEVIEDGVNGFVFENENVDSLIAKCRELILLETSVITKLSKNAIHTVEERFNWKKSRLALVSFVKSFLGKNE
jgi:glycosyltransferase involved in cell wall biosynthesis